MPQLYHHPLCPHSRFIRLALGEYGVEAELIEERVHERRRAFLLLDPAGQTPVLVEDGGLVVPGAGAIAEWLDETLGERLGDHRLLPTSPAARVEVRRLTSWFNEKFFDEVSNWLVTEKVFKRFTATEIGGGAPDMDAVRAARANLRYHLRYVSYLAQTRNWLAGERMTYADLAAAAHLSSVDFLGDAPWDEEEPAKQWYQRLKSRPSFRPLLADRAPGVMVNPLYTEVDF
ncbi:glutathione S-transferase family protein [uncultured Rhodoblastus sp.]|uniref:glutathione S-transferase family protein n=1 Tax=uncultured Rhodoblastus sp. TaxID=543037 RepID=UPI0025F6EF12|nr:glutathione S-transferase family protein [uncultured Rhodoblastus sp.]